MTPRPDYSRNGIELYCGDCRDILPHLSGVDAVVTDPPYGINADRGQRSRAGKQHGRAAAPSSDYGDTNWDTSPINDELLGYVMGSAKWKIIFGGNYYNLPSSRCWLVWDKLNGANDYADCELAWTNLDKAVRRLQFMWHGMLRDGHDGERVHPTQKPVDVMQWCLSHLPENAETILDPFMGSGTTGVACIRTGRKFIGIEREPKYFDIAVKRIEAEFDRAPLFAEQLKETQAELFGEAAP